MPNDIMRNAMQALDAEDARAELTPLHQLLLDLAGFVSRFEDVETDENFGSIKEAYAECAQYVETIARKYLAPDGSVLPGPTVLIEVEDGEYEIGCYNYPIDVVLIDYDNVREDGEYAQERKEDVQSSAISEDDKRSVLDRLNSF